MVIVHSVKRSSRQMYISIITLFGLTTFVQQMTEARNKEMWEPQNRGAFIKDLFHPICILLNLYIYVEPSRVVA